MSGLADADFAAVVSPLLDRAALLDIQGFQATLVHLHREFFSVPEHAEKTSLITEAIVGAKAAAKVPDEWWLKNWNESGDHRILNLATDTPACRYLVGRLMRDSFEKPAAERNHAVATLLAVSPHAFTALCEYTQEQKEAGAQLGWWCRAAEHFKDSPETGARRTRKLYSSLRTSTRNALRGHEPSVAKLAQLYAAHPWTDPPVEEDTDLFIQTGVGRDACLLEMPATVPGLVLNFGTSADVRLLSPVVDWAGLKVNVSPPVSMKVNVWRSLEGPSLGAVDAAFALKNPNALEVWKALSDIGVDFTAPTPEQAHRKALMTVAAWQGGRPRIELNAKGAITNMVIRDTPSEQDKVCQLASVLIPNTPSLWRAAGKPPMSVFLTALRSGNMTLAERAWSITQGLVVGERDRRGNALHALLKKTVTPSTRHWLSRLVEQGISLVAHNTRSEMPGDVLARQPAEVRKAWEAEARQLGISLPMEGAQALAEKAQRKNRKRGSVASTPDAPASFNAAATEQRRRAEDIAERVAARRAEREEWPEDPLGTPVRQQSRVDRRP